MPRRVGTRLTWRARGGGYTEYVRITKKFIVHTYHYIVKVTGDTSAMRQASPRQREKSVVYRLLCNLYAKYICMHVIQYRTIHNVCTWEFTACLSWVISFPNRACETSQCRLRHWNRTFFSSVILVNSFLFFFFFDPQHTAIPTTRTFHKSAGKKLDRYSISLLLDVGKLHSRTNLLIDTESSRGQAEKTISK